MQGHYERPTRVLESVSWSVGIFFLFQTFYFDRCPYRLTTPMIYHSTCSWNPPTVFPIYKSAAQRLQPCAVGGSALSEWMPEAPTGYFSNALRRAQTALTAPTSALAGVLWCVRCVPRLFCARAKRTTGRVQSLVILICVQSAKLVNHAIRCVSRRHQGETDAASEAPALMYGPRLASVMHAFRSQLAQLVPSTHDRVSCEPRQSINDWPWLLGELGDFLGPPLAAHAAVVNAALHQTAATEATTWVVSAAGLEDKGDSLHFTTEAANELGRRYAATWNRQR